MKPNPQRSTPGAMHWTTRMSAATAVAACLALTSSLAILAEEFRLITPTPGGIPPGELITNVTVNGNSMVIKWHGFGGPYQVVKKTNVASGLWEPFGAPVAGNQATVTLGTEGIAILGVTNNPAYAGASVCADCHTETHPEWQETRHANAFQTLKSINQHQNASCLPCHTVGFGSSGGFKDEAATPGLIGVQCENCHGPAGKHVDDGGSSIFPVQTKSAMLCGGCHNGFHHPTYDEWLTSGHAQNPIGEELMNADGSLNSRAYTCGACHSAATRLAMVRAYPSTNVVWPTGHEAAETTVTCVTCHDTHGEHKYTNVVDGSTYTNQLRNPLTSTNFYSYTSSWNDTVNFATQYNPNVNICGQCHNARGATVGSSSRPPHHSVQYNVFLGNIGVQGTTAAPQGQHAANKLQCVGCHTHRHGDENPTPEDPVYTGHGFRYSVEACMVCHQDATGPNSATNLLWTTQGEVASAIAQTKSMLDSWATRTDSTWAQTNQWIKTYGPVAWEYTNVGQLSQNSTGTVKGPTSAEQNYIPQAIKEARFNLYLIEHDASKGVHNKPYALYLLTVAQDKVNSELAKP